MKTIVISAVNLRQGGTLTILRECLGYLSRIALEKQWRIVALVHKKDLCEFDNIEYLEFPDVAKGWGRRLWCEYVTMKNISKRLSPVYLWFSLHDTSPNVITEKQAVYCQTSFPFYKATLKDLYFSYKIFLFSILTRFAYRINIRSNDFLVVQQPWLRDSLSQLLKFDNKKIIVAPPQKSMLDISPIKQELSMFTFLYPAAPDCHKNFQLLCKAAEILEQQVGSDKFRVILTISGKENKYTKWLFRKWGEVKSISFAGQLPKEVLYGYYESSDCLVFPSKVETWGLPISEFVAYNKPMLISDLPYAKGPASGAEKVAFFNSDDVIGLMNEMKKLLSGDNTSLKSVEQIMIEPPMALGWEELFDNLMS